MSATDGAPKNARTRRRVSLPCVQLPTCSSRSTFGNGLGFALVKAVADLHRAVVSKTTRINACPIPRRLTYWRRNRLRQVVARECSYFRLILGAAAEQRGCSQRIASTGGDGLPHAPAFPTCDSVGCLYSMFCPVVAFSAPSCENCEKSANAMTWLSMAVDTGNHSNPP